MNISNNLQLGSAVCVKRLGPLSLGHNGLDPVLPGGDPGVDPRDVGLGALVAIADHPDHGVAASLGDDQGTSGVSLARVTDGIHRADVDTLNIQIKNLYFRNLEG